MLRLLTVQAQIDAVLRALAHEHLIAQQGAAQPASSEGPGLGATFGIDLSEKPRQGGQ